MALKAGYQGLKKAFKQSIESFMANMSDALIIKSLDDVLELSDEGELSIDIDSTPTENSDNPVSSGGVYEALQDIDFELNVVNYTGNGQTSREFTFSAKPSYIFGIYGDIDSRGYMANIFGFPYGSKTTLVSWRKDGISPGSVPIAISYDAQDDKKMTLTGSDSGQILNYTDGTYHLYYI